MKPIRRLGPYIWRVASCAVPADDVGPIHARPTGMERLQVLYGIARRTLAPQPLPADQEQPFLRFKAEKVVDQRRFAIIWAPVLWLCFFYWDVYHHSHFENFGVIVVMRLVGAAYLILLARLAFTQAFLDNGTAERLLMSGVVATWLALIVIMLASPAPNTYLDFYTGFGVILVFLFTILWIRPRTAIALAAALLVVFEIAQWWTLGQLPPGEVRPGVSFQADFRFYDHSARFYLLSFSALGAVIAHQLEVALRRDFLQQGLLRAEKQAVHDLNVELHFNLERVQSMHKALAEESAHSQLNLEAALRLKEEQRHLAVEADRKKSTFLAAAAHDLRQPMTALDAVVEALSHSLREGDLRTASAHMDLAQRSSAAMRNTLAAVLEISRLESGFVEPQYEVFDVKPLAQRLSQQFKELAEKKGIQLRLRLPRRGMTWVCSDEQLLERSLANLITNAIKYTPYREGSSSGVLVGVLGFPTHVRVDVYDTGIGIAHSDRDRIFEPFVQLSNASRDREKGLGLGLSIVSELIALLDQHRLDFSSKPGRGSRFSLDIPRGEERPLPRTPEHGRDIVDAASHIPPGTYVLLIEDDHLVAEAMNAVLLEWGCLVDRCESLAEVSHFALGAERVPDVVLTDYCLPDAKSARDVMRVLHDEFGRHLPTIVVSGEVAALVDLKDEADALLVKPAEHGALRQAICDCAAKAGANVQ